MAQKFINRIFLTILVSLLTAWFWLEVVSPGACPVPSGLLSLKEDVPCLEFWFARYQTLLVGALALAAAIYAAGPAFRQARLLERQHASERREKLDRRYRLMTDVQKLLDPQAWLDQDPLPRPGTPEFEARFGTDPSGQRQALTDALNRRSDRIAQLSSSLKALPLDAASAALIEGAFQKLDALMDNIKNNNLRAPSSRVAPVPHKPVAEMTTEEMLAFMDRQAQSADHSNKAEWDGDEMNLGPMYFYCVEHPDQMVTATFRQLSARIESLKGEIVTDLKSSG